MINPENLQKLMLNINLLKAKDAGDTQQIMLKLVAYTLNTTLCQAVDNSKCTFSDNTVAGDTTFK